MTHRTEGRDCCEIVLTGRPENLRQYKRLWSDMVLSQASPDGVACLIQDPSHGQDPGLAMGERLPSRVTTRQLEVLACLLANDSDRQIADYLELSLSSVRRYVRQLMELSKASRRGEILSLASSSAGLLSI